MTDSIHDGKRVAQQPKKVRVVVSLKTAGTFGLSSRRADEVIE